MTPADPPPVQLDAAGRAGAVMFGRRVVRIWHRNGGSADTEAKFEG